MRTLPGCHQPARRLPLLVLAAAAALGVRAAPSQQHHHHLALVAYASLSSSSSSSRRPSGGRGVTGGGGGSGSGKGRSRDAAAATGRRTPASYAYYVLHKPFQVMSQFSGGAEEDGGKRTLADVCGARVPRDVYPVGRLDYDSEGLLVLTNDPAVNFKLLDPVRGHRREYWAQVEGEVAEEVGRGWRVISGRCVDLNVDVLRFNPNQANANEQSMHSSPPIGPAAAGGGRDRAESRQGQDPPDAPLRGRAAGAGATPSLFVGSRRLRGAGGRGRPFARRHWPAGPAHPLPGEHPHVLAAAAADGGEEPASAAHDGRRGLPHPAAGAVGGRGLGPGGAEAGRCGGAEQAANVQVPKTQLN